MDKLSKKVWVVRDADGKLVAHLSKPMKGERRWFSLNCDDKYELGDGDDGMGGVKWTDGEPKEGILTLEVVENERQV